MGQLAKIRRLHLREGKPIKEVSRQLGLSRNTVRKWLREPEMEETEHPEWRELTIAEALQDETPKLMVPPKAFDGYIELLQRVSPTGLIHIHRNRYSVPITLAHQHVSVRLYPHEICIVSDGEIVAKHARSFERYITVYEWQHYIPIVAVKPGSLRNGAPFQTMPQPLQQLQRHLLQHAGGDRVMAQVLGAIHVRGLEAVLVAVELALESGRVSGEHVMNVLARLKEPLPSAGGGANESLPAVAAAASTLSQALREQPRADAHRYEQLRTNNAVQERAHVK